MNERLDGIPTRWSLVRQAHAAGQEQTAAQARQVLVLRYARAIRQYVGGMIKTPADADEVAQEVMVKLMQGNFAGADPNRGRFRDLLRTAVRNMVRDFWSKQKRQKAVAFDTDLLADADNDQEARWLSAWQNTVLEHALAVLKEFERRNPGNPAHTLLQWRLQYPDDSSEETATRLSAKLGQTVRADAARQMLRRARLRFAETLLTEIELGLAEPSPERIEEELASLGLLEHVRDFLPPDWKERGQLSPA